MDEQKPSIDFEKAQLALVALAQVLNECATIANEGLNVDPMAPDGDIQQTKALSAIVAILNTYDAAATEFHLPPINTLLGAFDVTATLTEQQIRAAFAQLP